MDREFSDQRFISGPTRRESGLYSGSQADPWFLLCCNALQVLCGDEDTLEAPEQFCRYFSVWRRRGNAFLFEIETWPAASISIGTTTGCWPRLIVPERSSFCSLGTVVISTRRHTSFSGWWRMVFHLALWDRVIIATGPLPAMGRGTRHLATYVTVLMRMRTPSSTLYFSECGYVNKYLWVDSERLVGLQCIANATICCLTGNYAVACFTLLGVLIRLLHVFVL